MLKIKVPTNIAASSGQPTRDRYLYHDMKCLQCIVSSVEISQYTYIASIVATLVGVSTCTYVRMYLHMCKYICSMYIILCTIATLPPPPPLPHTQLANYIKHHTKYSFQCIVISLKEEFYYHSDALVGVYGQVCSAGRVYSGCTVHIRMYIVRTVQHIHMYIM